MLTAPWKFENKRTFLYSLFQAYRLVLGDIDMNEMCRPYSKRS